MLRRLFKPQITTPIARPFSDLNIALLLQKEDPTLYDPSKYTIAQFFTRYMKSVSETKNGRIPMDSSVIYQLFPHAKTEQDFDSIFDAFLNYQGHLNRVSAKLGDQILALSLKLNCYTKMFEVLENHRFLSFYPHVNIFEDFVRFVCESGQPQEALEMVKIVTNQGWLPQSLQIYEILLQKLAELEAYQKIRDLYASIPGKEQYLFSERANLIILQAIEDDAFREELLFQKFLQTTPERSSDMENIISQVKAKIQQGLRGMEARATLLQSQGVGSAGEQANEEEAASAEEPENRKQGEEKEEGQEEK